MTEWKLAEGKFLEPNHIARLFIASFLLAVWLARRTERAALYWAIAYGSFALGSIARSFGLTQGLDLLIHFSSAGPAIYAVALWAGGEHFEQRVPRLWPLVAVVALTTAAINVFLIVAPQLAVPFVGLVLAAVTTWVAYIVGKKARRYRIVALLMLLQAVLLLLINTVMRDSNVLRIALAIDYGVLAMGLTYVMLKESEETIVRHSTHDPVTGLPNARLFLDQLNAVLGTTATDQTAVAVVFLNIDHFKRINDLYGHASGDGVLCEVAGRITTIRQGIHTLARYGADEFVMITSAQTLEEVLRRTEGLAVQLLASFKEPFLLAGTPITLTVRIGIEVAVRGAMNADVMVRHAGLASARQKGVQALPVHFFSPEMHERALRSLAIERSLRTAPDKRELYLAYQPIVELPSREIRKVEALLRWNSDELGAVSPGEFVPVAEASGLIVGIGRWVLEEACRQAAHWASIRPQPICVSINVSAMQVHENDFCDLVSVVLAENNLKPELIELELTESALLTDDPVVRSNLMRLRELGLRLSLDDFGTGFSSLSYLTRFRLDTLKIDQSFVRDIERDERCRRLTESICAIGRSLDMQLIAEGVESDGQATVLAAFGVNMMQGYLFGHPGPADAI